MVNKINSKQTNCMQTSTETLKRRENEDKFPSSSSSRILAKDKCKVSELLLLCKEDPDSVIDLFKSNRGNRKCLPDIEIDPESLQRFEEIFKNEECIPKLKTLKFNLIESVVGESKPINQRDLKSEHTEGVKGILEIEKSIDKRDNDRKTHLTSIFKNPLLCNDNKIEIENAVVSLSTTKSDMTQKENETVATEYAEISTLLPKVFSPITGRTKGRKHRKQRQKRDYMLYDQKRIQEESAPTLTRYIDSPAVAILKQVVREQKRQMKFEDNKFHERETQIETKLQNTLEVRKLKNIFSFLKNVNRGKYDKL